MIPTHLQRFTEPTPVLDHGFVRLVDVFGDDGAIVTREVDDFLKRFL